MEDEKSLVHDGNECSSRLHSEINQNETGFFSRLSRSDSLKSKSNNMFLHVYFQKILDKFNGRLSSSVQIFILIIKS